MSYEPCTTCGNWPPLLSDRPHVCPPTWIVHCADWHDEGDGWRTYARDAEEAAEKFGEHYDEGEYGIVGGDVIEVLVWPESDPSDETKWSISGESVPTYSARQISSPPPEPRQKKG